MSQIWIFTHQFWSTHPRANAQTICIHHIYRDSLLSSPSHNYLRTFGYFTLFTTEWSQTFYQSLTLEYIQDYSNWYQTVYLWIIIIPSLKENSSQTSEWNQHFVAVESILFNSTEKSGRKWAQTFLLFHKTVTLNKRQSFKLVSKSEVQRYLSSHV